MQKKLPLINSAHGSETRNIINELINLFNGMGYTYDESLQKAHDVLKEAQKTNDMNKDVQRQLDGLIIESGNANAEVSQARGGAPLLRDRLNSQDKVIEDNKILSLPHGNLVEKLLNLIDVRGMYVEKDSNGLRVGIGMAGAENEVVEYRFSYDGDGLLLLRGVLSGVEDVSKNEFGITLNGAFNQAAAPNTFTTTVGDSFSFEFEGSSLFFKSVTENRGGMWEFTLDNGMKRNISCYSPTTLYSVERMVFVDLPFKKYKGVATFIGDDPVNPPSSGAGTSRVYVYHKDGDGRYNSLRHGRVRPLNSGTAKWIVSNNSIPDFAFNVRPNGTSYSNVWVPHHGSTTNVALETTGKIFFDGLLGMEIINNNLPGFTYREIKSIKISQLFVANNPNGADVGMWRHKITHKISLQNPLLSIENDINMLTDTYVASGYFGMLPAPQTNMSKLVLSNGTTYSPLLSDGSSDSFDLDVNSAMFVGENTPGRYHASAMDVTSVRDAVSLGESRSADLPGTITFREDNVAKVYFNFSRIGLLKAGERYTVTHRIACLFGERFPTTL